jgi:hypothetical protein
LYQLNKAEKSAEPSSAPEIGCENGLDMTLAPEQAKRRLQRINEQLRQLGYSDELKILQPQPQAT